MGRLYLLPEYWGCASEKGVRRKTTAGANSFPTKTVTAFFPTSKKGGPPPKECGACPTTETKSGGNQSQGLSTDDERRD